MDDYKLHGITPNVDLQRYAERIASEEDRPLFDDAVECGKAGALRAAYIMIWLACAESLKRRFRDASQRDNTAGEIVGNIDQKETNQQAVDKFLLEQAKEFGFISGSGYTALEKVYEMRCIYGHPYEQAPSPEQLISAAAEVVDLLLSRPVKLRHGFGGQLLDSLLKDRNYLDDHEPAVRVYAKNVTQRLDESIFPWLLDRYWKELESISDDRSMVVFFNRGVWFCRAFLEEVGAGILSSDDWHDLIGKFPKTLIRICGTTPIFEGIGGLSQDSLVGSIIAESADHPGVLGSLEILGSFGFLSERQQIRFSECVFALSRSDMARSDLSTMTCYPKLINGLQSHNWYSQNDAMYVITSNGPEQAFELTEDQQEELGRNILQSADGDATRALTFLKNLPQTNPPWPIGVLRGIFLESFVNEKNDIRLKVQPWPFVLDSIVNLGPHQRDSLLLEIVGLIEVGESLSRIRSDDLSTIIDSLNPYLWAEPLVRVLKGLVADAIGDGS